MVSVLVRDPQGECTPQALLCTGPSADPAQILEWFVLRWQPEVTPDQVRGRLFQEVRAPLGVETQRQWPDRAIARTTPILMGRFSWTTLAAPSSEATTTLGPSRSSLVGQAVADLRGCHRSGAPPLGAGVLKVFHCPPPTLKYGKSRPLCTTGLPTHWLTLLELRKVEVRAGRGVRMGPGPAFARGCWRCGRCAVVGRTGVSTGGGGLGCAGAGDREIRGQAE